MMDWFKKLYYQIIFCFLKCANECRHLPYEFSNLYHHSQLSFSVPGEGKQNSLANHSWSPKSLLPVVGVHATLCSAWVHGYREWDLKKKTAKQNKWKIQSRELDLDLKQPSGQECWELLWASLSQVTVPSQNLEYMVILLWLLNHSNYGI